MTAVDNYEDHQPTPTRTRRQRIPPHDLAAEQWLLGAMLLSPKACTAATNTGLTAASFYNPAHGHIYQACTNLHADGQPVDPITVADQLHRDALLENIGGTTTLIQLQTSTPAIGNAARYATIIDDHARLRHIINTATQIAELGYSLPDDVAKTEARVAQLVRPRPRPNQTHNYIELDDFLNVNEPDHNWIIPGLLEHADRCIITAVAGHGKSTLLRQIGVMAASGLHPFTAEHIDPVRVLILDVENSDKQVRREIRPLRQTANTRYQPDMLRLRVYNRAIDITDPATQIDLCDEIENYQPAIIICGPLYKLIAGNPTEEQPAKAAADAFDRLRGICGSAVLIEAHSPYASASQKKREIRPYGASLWERWPEFGWHFNAAGDIEHWRGQREQRDWPTAIQRSTPWPWTTRTTSDPAAGGEWHGPTQCIAAIIDLLELAPNEELSTRSLESRLRAIGKSFRSETIREAAERAALNHQIDVRTGPRNSRLYSIRTQPDEPLGEQF